MKVHNETVVDNWNDFWSRQGGAGDARISWSKRRIMAVLDKYVNAGMVTLDAGCGSGFFTGYFVSKGCRSYALDYSSEALAIAKKTTGGRAVDYIQADLLEKGFGDRYGVKFDLIFTDGLFEHFSNNDQTRIMDNFIDALEPDGLVVTFCPNRYSPWQIIRPLYMPGIKETPMTGPRMRELHKRLDILESGGVNVLPFRLSPEKSMGGVFGMILYCIARKEAAF